MMLKAIPITLVFIFCSLLLWGATPKQSVTEYGKYIVITQGCADCHSPKIFTDSGPEPDMTRYLSGHPAEDKIPEIPRDIIGPDKWGAIVSNDTTVFVDSLGITFTRNLTPDVDTGLGSWTEEMFMKALRTGKHMGAPDGRDIHPCMPWQAFRHLNDRDLKAIWAYLRTLKPVKNAVPDPIPASVAFSEKKK